MGWEVTKEESPSHEPQATIFSHMLLSPKEEQELGRTTTYVAPFAAKRNMTEYTASPARTERENPYLLLVTASVAKLDLGQVMIPLEGPLLREMHSETHRWWPPSR